MPQSIALKGKMRSGKFKALEGRLAKEPGVKNPAGLAAYIGRKKMSKGKC